MELEINVLGTISLIDTNVTFPNVFLLIVILRKCIFIDGFPVNGILLIIILLNGVLLNVILHSGILANAIQESDWVSGIHRFS
jgi:hypothetical protein